MTETYKIWINVIIGSVGVQILIYRFGLLDSEKTGGQKAGLALIGLVIAFVVSMTIQWATGLFGR